MNEEEIVIEGWIVYEVMYRSGCKEIRIRNYLDEMIIKDQDPMYVKVIETQPPKENAT